VGLREKWADRLNEKYLVVVRKKQDFSVLGSVNISIFRILILGVLSFIIVFGLSLILARTFLRQWFDPMFMETENTAKVLMLTDMVDSLTMAVSQKDTYLANLEKIMEGNVTEMEDLSAPKTEESLQVEKPEGLVYQPSAGTQSILDEFQGLPLESTPVVGVSNSTFMETYFFPPIKGVLTAVFSPKNDHFGVDVVAKENEPVKAIAGGTVIWTSWTLETGYVISIQHSNDLISIYKHNSVILKHTGDVVRAGEIVSVIGNTGELTTGPHLHFELWYKGTPLNPKEFITFD
jgi:murein DD-endopeptidase MepM/ murein hydrolase activator NlpD